MSLSAEIFQEQSVAKHLFRNEPPNPAKYFSERPKMTSPDEEPRKPKREELN
jgi:hypothetical protein